MQPEEGQGNLDLHVGAQPAVIEEKVQKFIGKIITHRCNYQKNLGKWMPEPSILEFSLRQLPSGARAPIHPSEYPSMCTSFQLFGTNMIMNIYLANAQGDI